jgi:hypothetical protein
MPQRLIFWVLMLIWFVFQLGVFGGFVHGQYVAGGALLEFVLFMLLGWQCYGAPVDG